MSAEHAPSLVVTPVKRGNNVPHFTELPCRGLQGTRRVRAAREPSRADSGKADCYHPLKSLLSPPLRTSWALSSHMCVLLFSSFFKFPSQSESPLIL